MTYSFIENVKPHDNVVQHLMNNSYNYFGRVPVYHVDTYIKPLAQLCNELGNRYDDESNQRYFHAFTSNSFFQEFGSRFLLPGFETIRDGEFLNKIGDIILDISNCWHLIEVKTSSTDTFTVNVHSLSQYAKIRYDQWQHVHFLFFNTTTGIARMMNLNDLCSPQNRSIELLHHPCGLDHALPILNASPIPFDKVILKEHLYSKRNEIKDSVSDLYYKINFQQAYGYEPKLLYNYLYNIYSMRPVNA